ncbi:MAG: ATP-binding protein [Pseudomonadota bacterium]
MPIAHTARVVTAVGAAAVAVPLVMVLFIPVPFDIWISLSHFGLLLLCGACALGMRLRRLQPVVGLYSIGLAYTASNVLLLQHTGDVVYTIPSFLLMVCALLVPIPLKLTLLVLLGNGLNVVVGEARFSFGVDVGLQALILVGGLAVIVLTLAVRWQREAFYLRLREDALASIAETQRAAREKQQLLEKGAQDEKLRSLGSLAGGVVHDLNNLLLPIVGNTELVLQSQVAQLQRERLEDVLASTQQAVRLIAQLNAFAVGIDEPAERLDLAEEVERIQKLVWGGLREEVELVAHYPSAALPVLAGHAQLHQIVANLLKNAVEAVVGMDQGQVKIDVRRCHGHAEVCVADNGPGIDEGIRDRLFEPFQSTKGEGRGMGLAAVHGTVKRLQGEITINSHPGNTEVIVSLPVLDM